MFDQEWAQEKTDRHLIAAQRVGFGVSYLDDALLGILPNDLMLIGARTGRGKTELATTLAYHAASQERQVVFFALEADRWEIHRRMKYRRLLQLYHEHYADKAKSFQFPRYREWLMQGHYPEWDSLEREAERQMAAASRNLRIVYKGERYTAQDFVRDVEAMSAEADLFIVDHLHYFDLLGSSESEGLKQAAHAVRNAALFHSKPVILLAHLRKGERNSGKSLPELDDFHGHSDIVKVATLVLLLSPVPAEKVEANRLGAYPTYFHIAKARSAAEVTPYVGVHGFEFKANGYSERYHLERTAFGKDPEAVSPSDIPTWAKRAIRPAPAYYGGNRYAPD